ncbi:MULTISPECIES: tRNA (adenosine(37)-N6)-threonylcarbamoyltransferase complex ATPase subunit type 1 TsaE [Selenomonas]|jgi:hydrolase, P-loop family|uniref:tRNA (adenosine(37)-N6)-threonylcarbamoyltransferase complex ATPase subunit type 1 TsaE n=1 Tax=Selenomonas TaxID=970 RepID=UPI0007680B82|nr:MULTISPECIES: tRNA (adenosine(37)-N6)-threonylcarbamoyltransferase complex ATPase subunit type 1 TsaE [Selenomonas]AME02812.1 tRNA threonylcarbamoyladenosine biosynthesis protein TsaE [Selenomonas sp. oral taxon 136]MBF1684313.1 tRNA (adenosine(37)-N6)-threonylcarbamoyltransferase complex ATPase subunit type 1 TsaE [Selenomonas sp.]MBF1686022.1 tRNA (adenosine(37)-N6)-threonylcarbamoyltransferase complex ATPase subunit type 1 TsaE [Selenomonas sp.]MBF1687880.1 tRNA (adenosine(37)-N6)-threony
MLTCVTHSPEETAHLAGTIGKIIREGTVICLDGELGVGKTLFVRALARTLGVESDVTSPTFNLMNIYEAACPIVHFDLYRITSEEELEDIGFYEYAEATEGIVLIEWAEKFPDAMPADHLSVRIEALNDEERQFTFVAKGKKSRALLEELKRIVDREP